MSVACGADAVVSFSVTARRPSLYWDSRLLPVTTVSSRSFTHSLTHCSYRLGTAVRRGGSNGFHLFHRLSCQRTAVVDVLPVDFVGVKGLRTSGPILAHNPLALY